MKKVYSYGKQVIRDDDIQAVISVLKSEWLTQGPRIAEFERDLRIFFSSGFASVASNGTATLHLIALALGWQQGDVILTSPITFLASANCILYAQATPDFVDIDPTTYTIDTQKLEEKLQVCSKSGKKVKAVVAVDFAGHPCNWRKLKQLSQQYGFQLVNDAAHALGATIDGNKGYAVTYADAVNLSFHPVKHITTGEGGAALTNNETLDKKIKMLRTHGLTKDESILEKNDGPWYYEMHALGFNYRITDFQCALGMSQLRKLDDFLKARREVARYYDQCFSGDDRFIIPSVDKTMQHAYHLYPLQIRFDRLKKTKKEIFSLLRDQGITCQVHYIPIHLQPFYRKTFGFKPGDFPVAELFYQQELSIPMYPGLTSEDLQYISTTITKLVR
jgi:UDP-4-amino-4,6-dideoxy-N-acetyl-beta-L-altrosamine transaminase